MGAHNCGGWYLKLTMIIPLTVHVLIRVWALYWSSRRIVEDRMGMTVDSLHSSSKLKSYDMFVVYFHQLWEFSFQRG